MPTFDYQAYLASREWALKREEVRKRSRGMCERCWRYPQQAVHHLTYARVGHELLEDLLAVCNLCHDFLSGKSDNDPAAPITNPQNLAEQLFPTPELRRAELFKEE